MKPEATPAHALVELTLPSPSGPYSLGGTLVALRQRTAEVALLDRTHDTCHPSARNLQEDTRIAVIVKDPDGCVLDIVPSRIKAIASGAGEPRPRLFVELGHSPNLIRERRSARRARCKIPLSFVPISYGNKRIAPAREAAGNLYDISTRGAKLGTVLDLPLGLFVELRLKTGGPSRVIAKIVNRQSVRGEYRYGLMFIEKPGQGPGREGDG